MINDSSTNSTYRDLYYVQTADIDLSAHYWDAIGYSSSYSFGSFGGNYDGGGYEISGIYTQAGSTDDYSYQGLFGYVRGRSETNMAIIKNIGTIDSNIQGRQYVGGVVGYAYENSIITNCYNTGNVTGGSYVGGVVGHANYRATITNCYNTGHIDGSYWVGGVVGLAEYYSTITNCYNTGSATGSRECVGGVVGFAMNSSTVTNCYNTGTMTGNVFIGGVVGAADYSTITNCYNTGSVTGGVYSDYVGGVVGDVNDSTITNCYNTGTVSGSGDSVGGVVGRASESGITNCYYGGNCTLSYGNGRGSNSGTSKDENLITNAKSLSWYQDTSRWSSSYPWDFENTWGFVSGMNDGYPVLIPMIQFTITYEPNGGTGSMKSQTKTGGIDLVLSINTFTRTGHTFQGWSASPTGSVVYADGATYSEDADITLYAVWEPAVYKITLDWNGGENNQNALTEIYVKYGEGVYSNASATTPLTSLSTSNLPRRQGFYLVGYYTANSTMSTCLITATDMGGGAVNGNFTDAFTTTYFTNDATLYAQWDTRNPAYYDEEGGYWYVENGKLPQTRVDDPDLKATLDENWDTLEEHSRFFIPSYGSTFRSKIYNGEEYCRANGNFYIVEPIRWRLTSNPNQEVGYGTTDDTYAILDTIVYAGRYSTEELGAGNGYQNVAVTIFEGNQISTTYLVTETKSMPTFGTGSNLYGEPQDVTDNIFVSSREEIMSVAGTYEIEFSDLIYDFITNVRGSIPLYYTRDLGTNYNHAICLTEDGEVVQRQPNYTYNQLGVQFTIKVSEYACVERQA